MWKDRMKGLLVNFSMLTINADEHSLVGDFYQAGDEKRMIVVLPKDRYVQ